MIKLLFDTNFFIDYFQKQDYAMEALMDVRKREVEGYSSVMTLYELYLGILGYPDEKQRMNEVQNLKNWFTFLPLGEQAMLKAAQIDIHLNTLHRTVDMRDLLIAATAITQNIPLKTRNKKDFQY